jgi:hypothetical protein
VPRCLSTSISIPSHVSPTSTSNGETLIQVKIKIYKHKKRKKINETGDAENRFYLFFFKFKCLSFVELNKREKRSWEGKEQSEATRGGPPNKPPQTTLTRHVFMAPPKTKKRRERDREGRCREEVKSFFLFYFSSLLPTFFLMLVFQPYSLFISFKVIFWSIHRFTVVLNCRLSNILVSSFLVIKFFFKHVNVDN